MLVSVNVACNLVVCVWACVCQLCVFVGCGCVCTVMCA